MMKGTLADQHSDFPRKLAICVTAHYNESRLSYLRQVSAHFRELATQIRVFIITNTVDREERAKLSASVDVPEAAFELVTPTNLGHPWLLPWVHFAIIRPLFASDLGTSHFMYVEDDELVRREAVAYWMQARNLLRHTGLIPSFLRVERKAGEDRWYSTDCVNAVPLASVPSVELDDELIFVNLPNPYQGMYFLDRELMAEHLNAPSSNPDFGPWLIREKATQGLTFWNVPAGFRSRNVIPYLPAERRVPEQCFVYHLPNNYANNPDPENPFGRVPVNEMLTSLA